MLRSFSILFFSSLERNFLLTGFSLILIVSSVSSVKAEAAAGQAVVINEIHSDPDVKTELVEYVELYNFGTTDVNLAGWYFSDGISYRFPAGSILPAGGFVHTRQKTIDY